MKGRVKGLVMAGLLAVVLLSGCSQITDFLQPVDGLKIQIQQVFALPTGTSVSISKEYKVADEDLSKLKEALNLPFQEDVATEGKQFVMEILLPAAKENQALKNGTVCLGFDDRRIEYLVIAAEGIDYDADSGCYKYGGVQVYQPGGWHLKLVGLAKEIGDDEFIGTPINVSATGDDYSASVDYSMKIVH